MILIRPWIYIESIKREIISLSRGNVFPIGKIYLSQKIN
jgi:hypothetical protein